MEVKHSSMFLAPVPPYPDLNRPFMIPVDTMQGIGEKNNQMELSVQAVFPNRFLETQRHYPISLTTMLYLALTTSPLKESVLLVSKVTP